MQGGIIDKDMPVPASNVAILCPSCGPSRVGYRFDDDGTKARVCKKCGKDL
jgi:large subunit ribosomal protein L24